MIPNKYIDDVKDILPITMANCVYDNELKYLYFKIEAETKLDSEDRKEEINDYKNIFEIFGFSLDIQSNELFIYGIITIIDHRYLKQMLIIRKDLKMRRGKEITQAGHAIQYLMEYYKDKNNVIFDIWCKTGARKITTLVNSEDELLEIKSKLADNGIPQFLVTDLGHTEFNGIPTNTVLGTGVDFKWNIDKVTGKLDLY